MAATAHAGPAEQAAAAMRAATWLESVQNADGSWGSDPATRALYTAEVVEALRAEGQAGVAYLRAITWLENHDMPNLDLKARRISALLAHGDDVTADRDALIAAYRTVAGHGDGWGLASSYGASAMDSALVLLAIADLGVTPELTPLVQGALNYLIATPVDLGWTARGNTNLSVPMTALVLRAYRRHMSTIPVLTSTLSTQGDAARLRLSYYASQSSDPFIKSQAALGIIGYMLPPATTADVHIDSLVSMQDSAGHWQNSVYTTAIALRALAIRLNHSDPALQSVVALQDFEARSAVNLALGRNRGDLVRCADVQGLTVLNARGLGITNLGGLGDLTHLQTLDLRDNSITDITAIAGLSNTTVLLQGNPWTGRLCDINGDNRLDSADALLATRMISGSLTPTLLQKTRADVGPTSGPGDGRVDVGDGVVLIRAATGADISICNP